MVRSVAGIIYVISGLEYRMRPHLLPVEQPTGAVDSAWV